MIGKQPLDFFFQRQDIEALEEVLHQYKEKHGGTKSEQDYYDTLAETCHDILSEWEEDD